MQVVTAPFFESKPSVKEDSILILFLFFVIDNPEPEFPGLRLQLDYPITFEKFIYCVSFFFALKSAAQNKALVTSCTKIGFFQSCTPPNAM